MFSGGSRVPAGGAAARRWPLVLWLLLWLASELPGRAASASANYQIPHDTLDAGGARAASVAYGMAGSLGGFSGLGTAPLGGVTNRVGFTGQLNAPPVAVLDVILTPFETAVVIAPADLLGNDHDPEDDELRLVEISLAPGTPGTLQIVAGGTRFEPAADFSGEADLIYTVSDGIDGETTGSIVVIVGEGGLTPVINWPDPADIVYGTALGDDQLNASADVPGEFQYTPAAGVVLAAGANQTLSLTFVPEDTVRYETVTVTSSINVTKAVLTVTAIGTGRFTGAPNPELAYGFTGWVNGDTAAAVTGAPDLATEADGASVAGDYAITITAGTLGAANYQFAFVNGTLTVTDPVSPGPRIQGTTGAVASITDKQTAQPFAGVTILNPADPARVMTTTVTLDDPLKGRFLSLGGFVESPPRRYTFTGAAAVATAALRGLVFDPTENRVAVGATETTIFTLAVNDGVVAPLSDTQVRVVATSANDVPVANGLSVERPSGRTVKIAVAKLLANVDDPDPDTLTLVGVSNPSAFGGEVVVDGDWVIYMPNVGFNQTDTFEYTINDGHGLDVTGVVTVMVRLQAGDPTKNIIALVPEAGGAVRVTFIGIAGRDYAIEAAPTLTNPVWVRLGIRAAGPNGVFDYLDTAAGGFPERFYRAVRP